MKALIFDCDGTLADTMPLHYLAWRDTMRRYGIAFAEDRFYALGGVPTTDIAAALLAEAGVTAEPAAVAHEKELAYMTHLAHVAPHPAVLPIVAAHRGKLPMAVATGSQRWIAEKTLGRLAMLGWFDTVVCAEDVTRPKPAPDIFLEAARRLGAAPGNCVVYEDSAPGFEAAAAAGMRCVDVHTLGA
ncbi:MAG: HAD family hydrolase [Planctomycetota bacterium]